MRRREFIKVIVGAASAWPVAALGQQTMPVIGFLNAASPKTYARQLAGFLKGLGEAGYTEDSNVKIEYRWANDKTSQLPALAADLVHREVTVIAATSTPAAVAAKAATTKIPIVFECGSDPIELGLVASLSRLGGNVTGVTGLTVEVAQKRLELLHELLPTAHVMALLVNPAEPTIAKATVNDVLGAARGLELEVHVLNASKQSDFDEAFSKLAQLKASALVMGGGPLFVSYSEQLAALTLRHAIPAVFPYRAFAAAGGLLSYGSDISESYRLAGIYTGRILKGEKPTELPVQQASKVELFINLKTAKMLGITVPNTLIGRADEVFE